MPAAFVLISTETGTEEEEVLRRLRRIEGVGEVCIVYGLFDIVAKVEADSAAALEDVVTRRIRRLRGVRSALTLWVVES